MRVCVTPSTLLAGDLHHSTPSCMTDYEYPYTQVQSVDDERTQEVDGVFSRYGVRVQIQLYNYSYCCLCAVLG